MAYGKRKRDSIHETPDVSFITNPDVAHEESDVAVRPLLWFVGGLTFFTIVVCAVVLLMFTYFQRREESQELEASPLARTDKERLPPEPRLQLSKGFGVTTDDGHEIDLSNDAIGKTSRVPQPQSEYLIVSDEWARELEDYGWADQQSGTVRVPVEEAMRLYLQHQRAKQQAQQQGAQKNTPGDAQATPSATPAGGKP